MITLASCKYLEKNEHPELAQRVREVLPNMVQNMLEWANLWNDPKGFSDNNSMVLELEYLNDMKQFIEARQRALDYAIRHRLNKPHVIMPEVK